MEAQVLIASRHTMFEAREVAGAEKPGRQAQATQPEVARLLALWKAGTHCGQLSRPICQDFDGGRERPRQVSRRR
jgi:hypothetical protein